MTDIQKILISRRMLVASKYTNAYDTNAKIEKAYLNAFLLSNFGIVVNKPELLTKEMVKDISDVYKLEVPASYFKNPQDTRFYTAEELLIEQCVSYFLAYGAEDSHVKIFDKELPEYPISDEIASPRCLWLVEITQYLCLIIILISVSSCSRRT